MPSTETYPETSTMPSTETYSETSTMPSTETSDTPILRLTQVTPSTNGSQPTCKSRMVRINDQFMGKPDVSTSYLGSISDLNPDGKGIDFTPSTSSTPIIIVLPFKVNTTIIDFVRIEIPRPSNVQRFHVTFLDRNRRSLGPYQILSTNAIDSSISPIINRFPLDRNIFARMRAVKITILDTNDDQAPKQVTIEIQACLKKSKTPKKSK
jgi:hypothetical protein